MHHDLAASTHIHNVTHHGAVGDGVTLCSDAFAAAIDAAAASAGANGVTSGGGGGGGGVVYVPPGRYLTGSIFLRSHVCLWLDPGAVILGSQDPNDYPIVTTRWEGQEVRGHAALIAGSDLEHVAIAGYGTIDGQGAGWWRRHRERTLTHPRPRLINLHRCRHVRIEGLTLRNSPAWTVNPNRCDNVVIDRVTVINPPDSPNTDGINPESCRNVRITNCHVDVGDDCITIKSGASDPRHPIRHEPCENIIVSNCTLLHGHGGVVIGSEMSGGVRDVVICNCIFEGTDRGIRIKTRRGRGGVIEDVRVSNVIMRRVSTALTINMFYKCGLPPGQTEATAYVGSREPQPVDERTPVIRNIHLSHVTARQIVGHAGVFMLGLPESPIAGVTLDDVVLETTPRPEQGAESPAMVVGALPDTEGEVYAENVEGLRLTNVRLPGRRGRGLWAKRAHDLTLTALHAPPAAVGRPSLRLEQAAAVRITGGRVAAGEQRMTVQTVGDCRSIECDDSATLQ